MTSKVSSITQRAIAQAMTFLRTSKCTYLILDEEGNEIANTLPRKERHKSGIQYKPHFKPFVDQLGDEGMITIEIPPEFEDVVKYRAALAGYLHVEYGRGGYITSLDQENRTVSVMVARGLTGQSQPPQAADDEFQDVPDFGKPE